MTESAPTTKAEASEPTLKEQVKAFRMGVQRRIDELSQESSTLTTDPLIEKLKAQRTTLDLVLPFIEESEAATRAALKDAIKELKIAIASIGRWNGSTVEQVEHASVPLVKEVISKLSALAGEQEG